MRKEIEFNRPAKYVFVRELGSGSCGETVLLHDEDMNTHFVAKKYAPFFDENENTDLYEELMVRFRKEAQLLFRLNHPNVVRVYNFYDYKEIRTAYILMEYIDGSEILDFLKTSPFSADRVFEGVVDGFAHLQAEGILHRDIRPANIIVRSSGIPKIIDFGFGKSLADETNKNDRKSISLNWWCETPPEFAKGTYDFQTEVYFVGKLFEKALSEGMWSDFKYKILVGKMCEPDRRKRMQTFQSIQSEINLGKFDELSFLEEEISTYRNFANALSAVVSTIQSDARFEREPKKVLANLEELYRRTMLEEYVHSPNRLVQVFVSGAFRYFTSAKPETSSLRRFIEFLRGLSEEKKAIVIENLIARLEASERTDPTPYRSLDDEIPF